MCHAIYWVIIYDLLFASTIWTVNFTWMKIWICFVQCFIPSVKNCGQYFIHAHVLNK